MRARYLCDTIPMYCQQTGILPADCVNAMDVHTSSKHCDIQHELAGSQTVYQKLRAHACICNEV